MTLMNEFVNLIINQTGFVIVLKIDQMTLLFNDESLTSTQILHLTLFRFLSRSLTQSSKIIFFIYLQKEVQSTSYDLF